MPRLPVDGWVAAEWGVSENNRKARYYRITAAGRKQLAAEVHSFDLMLAAIARVMEITFGNATSALEQSREQWGWAWLESVGQPILPSRHHNEGTLLPCTT